MRRALASLAPAFATLYNIRPWELPQLTEVELDEFLADIENRRRSRHG